MTIASFLKLVEIQTKVASVIPFALGSLYALFRFNKFNTSNFILMFLSLIAFDMATTAINNYTDYKKANKTHGYNYEEHNAIVRDNLKESTVRITIAILLIIAIVCGFILFLNTTIITLLLGGLSFLIGIIYSFGPIPISRTPLGEVFSGIFMGFVIMFISIYIHIYDIGIISFFIDGGMLSFSVNIKEIIYIFLMSVPAIHGIANIMLANNTCDIEDDLANNRYTLPIYIGKERALKLFKILYYISYVDILILLALRVAPITSLLTLLTLVPVNKNIKIFHGKQTKKDTFVVSVKNFVLINVGQIFALAIALIL